MQVVYKIKICYTPYMQLLTDKIKTLYIKYLIPSLFSAIVTSIYAFVDTIAIGKGVGQLGTAALSISSPIFGMLCFFGMLCGTGASVYIGKSIGEKDQDKANCYFTISLIVIVILTILFWLLSMIFAQNIYCFLGASQSLMPFVKDYAGYFFLAMPIFVFSVYLTCIIRSDSNPNLVMRAVIIGGILNIFGDYFFVFPLKMGMKGAAIASVLGSTVQIFVLASHFFSGKCTLKITKPQIQIKRALKIMQAGFSTGVIEITYIILTIIMNKQTLKYGGEKQLAAFLVVLTCSSLFQHIFSGIGSAIVPIVSTNYGALKVSRVLEVRNLAIFTSLFIGALFTALGIFFPKEIALIFLETDEKLIKIAINIIRLYFLSFLLMGVSVTATYYLQSVMKSKASCVISLLRGIIISGTLVMVFPIFFGINGMWYAMILTEIITSIFAFCYMQNRHNLLQSSYKV